MTNTPPAATPGASPAAPPGRRMRADAVRNRANLLTAARDLISERGPGVGIDDIAAAAGVAVGTVYRHFPTKEDLVAAVMEQYASAVADDAEAASARARAGSPAGAELVDFLSRVLEATSTVQAVKAASQLPPGSLGEGEQRAAAALAELLDRAQGDGQVQAGITVADVYLLVSTAPADQPGPVRSRWLQLVTRGLLTTPAARI